MSFLQTYPEIKDSVIESGVLIHHWSLRFVAVWSSSVINLERKTGRCLADDKYLSRVSKKLKQSKVEGQLGSREH